MNTHKSPIEAFKHGVIRIRDILRGPGICLTGMDSMSQISLYLFHHLIDNLQNRETSSENVVQFAIDLKNLYPLIPVAVPQKSYDIQRIIQGIDVKTVSQSLDILGWVYEQHLKKGSSGGGQRDLGQYFTDRSICEYMVKLTKPTPLEYICDPAAGTAGFLLTSMKYISETYPSDPISLKYYHGNEPDKRVVQLAHLNLLMEAMLHNIDAHFEDSSIEMKQKDTLYNDLPSDIKYDVILANIPFGLKGIVYEDCCDKIKELGIKGTKGEPLFLQVIMESLKPNGGRCAVIVPDGLLVNTTKVHIETRKHLLNNFRVRKIIKINGQFFMNTGIRPSILFFEKGGSENDNDNDTNDHNNNIEFWQITKSCDGGCEGIEESLITIVPLSRIDFDETCSLDLRKYHNPSGDNNISASLSTRVVNNLNNIPVKSLGEVCSWRNGKNIPKSQLAETYNEQQTPYPYYASNGITGYVPSYLFEGPCVLIGDQGTSWSKSVKYVPDGEKFYAGNHTIVMKVQNDLECITKYLYYSLYLSKLQCFEMCTHLIPELDKKMVFSQFKVYLPNLVIQTNIIETLDNIYNNKKSSNETFTNFNLPSNTIEHLLSDPTGISLEPYVHAQLLEKKRKLFLDDIHTHMKHVMNTSMMKHRVSILNIDEVLTIETGEYITSNTEEKGDYPVYGGGGESNRINRYNREPTIVINKDGISQNCVRIVKERFFLNHHGWTLKMKDNTQIYEPYIHWQLYLRSNDIYNLSTGTCQRGIKQDAFNKFSLHIPNMETQISVSNTLHELKCAVESLEKMELHCKCEF